MAKKMKTLKPKKALQDLKIAAKAAKRVKGGVKHPTKP
jgi:hypothetical protein